MSPTASAACQTSNTPQNRHALRDGTGQTNLFKWVAGLDPTNPASRFVVAIAPVPGQPGKTNVMSNPIASGRTYTVMASSTLGTGASWSAINASTPTISGSQETITDLSASGKTKFYHVVIIHP